MGGKKKSKKSEPKKKKQSSVQTWKGADTCVQNVAKQFDVAAFRLSKDTDLQNAEDSHIWATISSNARQYGKNVIFYEFRSVVGDLGDILIRAQYAICSLTRYRRIPCEYINEYILSEDDYIKQICIQIADTEHKFIQSIVASENIINDTCFVAYCENNYCMSRKMDIEHMVKRMLNTRGDEDFGKSSIECVICCEERHHYSSLWECNHVVCEVCCLKIEESGRNACPLCRSSSSYTTSQTVLYGGTTAKYLDDLNSLEEHLMRALGERQK